MRREWTDQRDGKAYRIEVESRQSEQEPGQPLANAVPWQLWFHADEAPTLRLPPTLDSLRQSAESLDDLRRPLRESVIA